MSAAPASLMTRVPLLHVARHSVVRCARCPIRTKSHYHALSSSDFLLNVSKNTALVSSSTDIYQNLALEDWIYSKCTFSPGAGLLLLWRDAPCVVIGRHQNPWTEVNVRKCGHLRIKIARRNSGGGTVYHDLGNINLSFITCREDYSRKKNLTAICSYLKEKLGIDSEISPREDLVTRNGRLKISGTASKLARVNAYHHCTLLVDADVKKMSQAIRKESPSVLMSRATSSVRSSTTNLSQIVKELTAESVMAEVAESLAEEVYRVAPSEQLFPSLNEMSTKLSSWDWIFGKTPRFAVQIEYEDSVEPLTLMMRVNEGKIEEASVTTDNRTIADLSLNGCKFEREEVEERLLLWSLMEDDHLLTCSVCKATEKLFDEVT